MLVCLGALGHSSVVNIHYRLPLGGISSTTSRYNVRHTMQDLESSKWIENQPWKGQLVVLSQVDLLFDTILLLPPPPFSSSHSTGFFAIVYDFLPFLGDFLFDLLVIHPELVRIWDYTSIIKNISQNPKEFRCFWIDRKPRRRWKFWTKKFKNGINHWIRLCYFLCSIVTLSRVDLFHLSSTHVGFPRNMASVAQ